MQTRQLPIGLRSIGLALMAVAMPVTMMTATAQTISTVRPKQTPVYVGKDGQNQKTTATPNHADNPTPSMSVHAAPLNLRKGAVSTGLYGFYDYQSNGTSPDYIRVHPTDPNKIFTTYMLSTDGSSADAVNSSRRVGYAYSSDGGATWTSTRDVGNMRLGFPSVDISTTLNAPFVVAHGESQGLRTLVYYSSGFSETSFIQLAQLPLNTESGATNGVIWPAFRITPDDKAVVLGSYSNDATTSEPQQPLQVLTLDPASGTVPSSWKNIENNQLSLTSGGRDMITRSASGKLCAAWYRFAQDDFDEQYGIYISESTDNGATWSTPTAVLAGELMVNDFSINGDVDTLTASPSFDVVYKGEEPMVTFTGFINNLYQFENVLFWTPSSNLKLIALAHQKEGLGAFSVATQIVQPNMNPIASPTVSMGDDGQHVLVAFSAVAQTLNETRDTVIPVASPEGFNYYRVWGVGSEDGGETWGEPFIIQDFAGAGTDSASIEYPTLGEHSAVDENGNFQMNLAFQARRYPGMYAFVATLSDGSSATAGPITETQLYFQRNTIDKSFFAPVQSSVSTGAATGSTLSLDRTYPNPATSRTTLSYSVPATGTVSINVYDALGTLVLAPVADQRTEAGSYSKSIDLGTLPTGAYRVVLTQNGVSASQPLTIVR